MIPPMQNTQDIYVDASLSDMGAIWGPNVYAVSGKPCGHMGTLCNNDFKDYTWWLVHGDLFYPNTFL